MIKLPNGAYWNNEKELHKQAPPAQEYYTTLHEYDGIRESEWEQKIVEGRTHKRVTKTKLFDLQRQVCFTITFHYQNDLNHPAFLVLSGESIVLEKGVGDGA